MIRILLYFTKALFFSCEIGTGNPHSFRLEERGKTSTIALLP
jgi:hypothetical protein